MRSTSAPHTFTAFGHAACLTLAGLVAACGSDKTAAEGGGNASAAAPTADEVNAAQASSQTASDGSEAGSAASQSSTTRQADVRHNTVAISAQADGLNIKRARCWSAALKAGQELVASSTNADIEAHLFGGASVAGQINFSPEVDTRSDLAGGGASLTGGLNGSGPATQVPMVFSATHCTLGGHVLSGNELISITASGAGTDGSSHDVQVRAALTYQVAGGSLQITSEDATKPTYELQTSLAAASTRTFHLLLNEHRVRTNAKAQIDLDVATTTPSVGDANALVMTETYAEVSASDAATTAAYASVVTREVVSGTVTTVHNLAKFTAQHSFDGLKHDLTGSCSCPVSGSMVQTTQAADASRTAAHTYVFTGCGQATVTSKVTTAAGSTTGTGQVSWANCD